MSKSSLKLERMGLVLRATVLACVVLVATAASARTKTPATEEYPSIDKSQLADLHLEVQFAIDLTSAMTKGEDEHFSYWFDPQTKAADVFRAWRKKADALKNEADGLYHARNGKGTINIDADIDKHLDVIVNWYGFLSSGWKHRNESFLDFILAQNSPDDNRPKIKAALSALSTKIGIGFLNLTEAGVDDLSRFLASHGAFLSGKFHKEDPAAGFGDMTLEQFYTAAVPPTVTTEFIDKVIQFRSIGIIFSISDDERKAKPLNGPIHLAGPGAGYCCCNFSAHTTHFRTCRGPGELGSCNMCAANCCLAGITWCPDTAHP